MSEIVVVPISELRDMIRREIQTSEERIIIRLSGNRLDSKAAMDILGIKSPTTFLNLVNQGKLKKYRDNPNSHPFYRADEVIKFASSGYRPGRVGVIG